MLKVKKWNIIGKWQMANGEWNREDFIDLLLENRGITTKKEREEFLHPKLESVTPESVGIDAKQLKKALTRIQKAIDAKEQIVVFGDYDVDGITGSAILWETLHQMGAKVLPYIPHRVEEGYGLSKLGITNLLEKFPEKCHPELVSGSRTKKMLKQVQHDKDCLGVKLIITTDNGIVAHEAVEFANKQGIDVIITDHHAADATLPDAYAIVHTTKLCGAGVAYLLSQEIKDLRLKIKEQEEDTHLELATLGTVADMVPLTGSNRAIVEHGLSKLSTSKRFGLQALYKQAGIQKAPHQNGAGFSTYEIGYIIGPRLNASGRVESAMDSLRLLCTSNRERAEELAAKLELVNKERQQMLKEAREHAIAGVRVQGLGVRKLLFVAHESYAPGIIGLVAGKLVEEFYRPAIVLSIGQTHSKASVRSVSGFNIIEFLRLHTKHFVNVGGHPMAAGFTVETTKLAVLQETLETKADELLTDDLLVRQIKIDCELPFSAISKKLYEGIQQLSPFGMGNPEPIFATRDVTVEDIRIMGKEGTHLKLMLRQNCHPGEATTSIGSHKKDSIASLQNDKNISFEAVGFGMGALAAEIHQGDTIDVAYTIDENTWNGNTKLQLKVKDIKLNKN